MKHLDYRKNFGLILRKIRLDKNISQETFADSFDINRTYYGKVERGENSVSIEKMQKISFTLNKPLSELIRLAEEL
jgi:transcriptional regulator with XRE-family HTH domain